MKNLILKIIGLPVALLAACNPPNQSAKAVIPGTYVNQAQSAYSLANDTLVIARSGGNAYAVIRKTGFQRVLNGQLQPEAHKFASFTGAWDAGKQVLQLAENGIVLVFDGDSLRVQNSIYHKLPGGRGL